jgi:hypothetical protein
MSEERMVALVEGALRARGIDDEVLAAAGGALGGVGAGVGQAAGSLAGMRAADAASGLPA